MREVYKYIFLLCLLTLSTPAVYAQGHAEDSELPALWDQPIPEQFGTISIGRTAKLALMEIVLADEDLKFKRQERKYTIKKTQLDKAWGQFLERLPYDLSARESAREGWENKTLTVYFPPFEINIPGQTQSIGLKIRIRKYYQENRSNGRIEVAPITHEHSFWEFKFDHPLLIDRGITDKKRILIPDTDIATYLRSGQSQSDIRALFAAADLSASNITSKEAASLLETLIRDAEAAIGRTPTPVGFVDYARTAYEANLRSASGENITAQFTIDKVPSLYTASHIPFFFAGDLSISQLKRKEALLASYDPKLRVVEVKVPDSHAQILNVQKFADRQLEGIFSSVRGSQEIAELNATLHTSQVSSKRANKGKFTHLSRMADTCLIALEK